MNCSMARSSTYCVKHKRVDVQRRSTRRRNVGSHRGDPLYHANLNPDDYTGLLSDIGFEVVTRGVEDWQTGSGRTAWLARIKATQPAADPVCFAELGRAQRSMRLGWRPPGQLCALTISTSSRPTILPSASSRRRAAGRPCALLGHFCYDATSAESGRGPPLLSWPPRFMGVVYDRPRTERVSRAISGLARIEVSKCRAARAQDVRFQRVGTSREDRLTPIE